MLALHAAAAFAAGRHALKARKPYSPPILLLDPSVARGFVDKGFAKKQQLIDWLDENAQVTAREYWNDPWTQTLIKPHAVAGVEPWASMWKAAPEALVSKHPARRHEPHPLRHVPSRPCFSRRV